MEVTEEQALLYEFTCPECGAVFSLKDSTETIKDAEKSIQKLRGKANEAQRVLDELVALRIAKAQKKAHKAAKKPAKKKAVKKPTKKKSARKKVIKKKMSKKKRSARKLKHISKKRKR